MATTTSKYNLIKPSLDDAADITAMNANWDKIDQELTNYGSLNKPITATSSDGVSYTATVAGVTELYVGLKITIIPSMTSANVSPTLNLNNLGARNIIMPIDGMNTSVATNGATLPTWLGANMPVTLTYDANNKWRSEVKTQSANYIYGVVPVEHGGHGGETAAEARTNLGVYSKTEIDTMFSSVLDEINGEVI